MPPGVSLTQPSRTRGAQSLAHALNAMQHIQNAANPEAKR
jgi:hypothetical protein